MSAICSISAHLQLLLTDVEGHRSTLACPLHMQMHILPVLDVLSHMPSFPFCRFLWRHFMRILSSGPDNTAKLWSISWVIKHVYCAQIQISYRKWLWKDLHPFRTGLPQPNFYWWYSSSGILAKLTFGVRYLISSEFCNTACKDHEMPRMMMALWQNENTFFIKLSWRYTDQQTRWDRHYIVRHAFFTALIYVPNVQSWEPVSAISMRTTQNLLQFWSSHFYIFSTKGDPKQHTNTSYSPKTDNRLNWVCHLAGVHQYFHP